MKNLAPLIEITEIASTTDIATKRKVNNKFANIAERSRKRMMGIENLNEETSKNGVCFKFTSWTQGGGFPCSRGSREVHSGQSEEAPYKQVLDLSSHTHRLSPTSSTARVLFRSKVSTVSVSHDMINYSGIHGTLAELDRL